MSAFIEGVLLASAARTTTGSGTVEGPTNGEMSGVVLILDVTAVPTVETLTPAVEIWIPGKGDWIAITAFTAQSATGTYVYFISSGGIETAAIANQEVAAVPLPLGRWRVKVTHSASGSFTYSLSYKALL